MQHLSLCPRREVLITRMVTRCQVLVRFFALRRIKPHAPLLVRPTPSIHRLRRGLPGYLILFAPHAFVPQCQLQSSESPSPLVFFLISTHSTATLGIPFTPPALKPSSFGSSTEVKPRDYATNLPNHLRTLYAQSFRITLASYVLPRLLARS